MGVVFQALDSRVSGRTVALKVRASSGESARKRFVREGQVTARIIHPNVLKVHEAFALGEFDVLLTELIPAAEPLDHAWMDLAVPGRVELLAQVASGVQAAHEQGVVHRDLKPENLLVSHGVVRVTDFGLAYVESADRLTQTGIMVGTPAFMSPEQARGQKGAIGPACDVWSLGALLYLAITNTLPFEGKNLLTLVAQISRGLGPAQHERLLQAPRALAGESYRRRLKPTVEGPKRSNREASLKGQEAVAEEVKLRKDVNADAEVGGPYF